MTAEVSVIVVSFNTREHLARCLAAIPAAAAGLPLETIVVDNASDDGSADMVAARFPNVRLIRSVANLGFGRATNTAAATARGRALLLLNSDCELAPGALATMQRALEVDAFVGAVFCRLHNSDGTLQPSVHRRLPSPWSGLGDALFITSLRHAVYRAPALKRLLLRRTAARHARAHDVAWGGAACMLVRRKAFDAVGGFDERFFMYSEDVDLCARLGAAGYRLRFLPEARATHHWGTSTAQRPAAMVRAAYVSRVRYFEKHFGARGGRLARAFASAELTARAVLFGALACLPLRGHTAWRDRAHASREARRALPQARRA